MNRYSKVYPVKGEKHYGYRYNYEQGTLEYVSKWDCYYDKEAKKLVDILFVNWVVICSVGLSQTDWNDNPQYWVDYYSREISEEANRELGFINKLDTLCRNAKNHIGLKLA